MRFNNKELAFLALQDSGQFDREGCLFIKQKTDKLFKKGDAFVERFFRLRGNLLFYFKGKEAKHDPLGLLVLERCTVELDIHENFHFSFLIVFEGDEMTYTFSATTEEDRDGWIQALHIASYECLKMQLQSLREQVQSRTGHDPLVQILPSDTGMDFETQSGNSTVDPTMEISLAIDGLPNDSNGQPPNPFVVVYIIVPPQQQTWLQHNHTEMVKGNNSPHFLKTIGFGDSNGLEPNTRVKVIVYHVKERMTGTMSQIGQVIFTLNNILMSSDMSLKVTIMGTDTKRIGELSIVGWLNEATGAVVDMQNSSEGMLTPRPLSAGSKKRNKRLDTLRPFCENIITRTFRFETNDGVKLLVYEFMAESKFTFDVPIKLLNLLIDEEKSRIKELQDLGKLPMILESHVAADVSYRATIAADYTDVINLLCCYRGLPSDQKCAKSCSNFKPSSKKGDKELEFVPVNLHLQRMTVNNESTDTCGCFDIITVGAFTAFARKYRAGGLMRLLQQQQEQYTPEGTLSKVTKVKKACELVNTLFTLQGEIVRQCDRVCQEALQGDASTLLAAAGELAEKVKELVRECESPILQETATRLSDIHEEYEAMVEQEVLKGGAGASLGAGAGAGAGTTKSGLSDRSPEKSWKWTGSCFVKSPTVEPWDMTRVNTEASLVCLTSMVEDLIENKSGAMDRPKWLGEISPAVMKLKSFIEIVCQKADHFMAFLDLVEHKDNLKTMHTIKCRRDVVFSHALTSLVTGFVTHVSAHINSPTTLSQVQALGLLVQTEGLLSCHGDETAMLEDMIVAVDDLAMVSFRLVLETAKRQTIELTTNNFKKAGLYPDLSRHHICVEVALKKTQFDKLPQKLQAGHTISVVPVFFNIGINEQATLAEKFGNTGLQDKTNEESFGRLYRYVESYEQKPEYSAKGKVGAGTITDLVKQLHYNVYTKKSKNVEVLHLAAELCQKLYGVRLTCCKSAKDRTAMSVTLEQVQILQREHDLASHVFMQSLDCFRSEGVRRENTFKNIGQRKYAFNSLQLLSFPKQYRPPNGTYGNVQN